MWECMTFEIMDLDNSILYLIQRIDCFALGIIALPSNNRGWPEWQLAECTHNMMIGFGDNIFVLLHGEGEQEWAEKTERKEK